MKVQIAQNSCQIGYYKKQIIDKSLKGCPRNLTSDGVSTNVQDNPSASCVRITFPTLSNKRFELETEFSQSNITSG